MNENIVDELVAQSKSGSTEAFGRLVEYFTPLVTRMVVAQGVRTDDRGDVIQEVFMRAFTSLHSFDSGRRFEPWLAGVAFRTIKNYWRNAGRRKEILESELSDNFLQGIRGPEGWYDPEEAALRNEEEQTLVRSLDALSKSQKHAVVCFYFEDMTVSEIADATGWSQSKVKVILYRARLVLRRVLKEQYEGR
ncbi:RNA polymerase sigma factor [Sphaerochaeta halotolerans]|uniref:RNA polymerase sigma factor n=1 Tax=Sphaerochaeta halotolerans TaxID=2293840 RepID=UPI001370F321|nr:sigma-70 family RNA polymerase sigma factor [Sphaerochaeta halotolerans]MXI85451.1 sigma-70 family RNA polymerase sigma factor [Sphaerochaeta halotolerans]